MLSSTNFANFTKKTANFTISNFIPYLNAIIILEITNPIVDRT